MPSDSDVALIGTGVAPLVAASHLLAQGKSVVLLNPDLDFFLEDSELSIDPLWPLSPRAGEVAVQPLNLERLKCSLPEAAIAELRPDFPGAVESWAPAERREGYHDWQAPHVRTRARLWIRSGEFAPKGMSVADDQRARDWIALEDLYVTTSDAGFGPKILDGIAAARRFPGHNQGYGEYRGMLLPRLADVDVIRYRNGLLEFVRERLGADRVVCSATQVQLTPDGIRFHSAGTPRTERLNLGILVFWTPRLTQWVRAQSKKLEVEPEAPLGVRLWEEWSLVSRESLDPATVGVFEDMTVWAEVEGAPGGLPPSRMAVLRPGPIVGYRSGLSPGGGAESWGSTESFAALSKLCHDFLRWEKFSVRALRPRAIFDWKAPRAWPLVSDGFGAMVVNGSDGYLVDVVRSARAACAKLLEGDGP